MRVYSDIYFLARKQKSITTEVQARSRASSWLREYFRVSQKPKLSMVVRRLMGINPFLRLAKS